MYRGQLSSLILLRTGSISLQQYLRKHLRRHIPPAYDSHGLFIRRQFMRVKQQRSCGHRSAWLRDEACGGHYCPHRGANFRLGYGDDEVDEGLNVGKVPHAYTLCP